MPVIPDSCDVQPRSLWEIPSQPPDANIAQEQRFYQFLAKAYGVLLSLDPISDHRERQSLKKQIELMKQDGIRLVHEHMRAEVCNYSL